MFATAFGLPTEGLTDVSDVPKDLVFDAWSLFSESEEQVSISCFKKEMKIEYRLLHDILAKTLFVKSGSFDAVTRERFMLMTAITFDVKINWGSMLFGVLKAMVTHGSRQAKGYAIQICVVLSKIGMEKAAGSTPVKKTVKKPMSKKRPATSETEVAPIAKKKRTTKGKPAELPPVPTRKSRKRRLVLEQEDDLVVDEPVEESATGVQETSTDVPASEEQPTADLDDIIEQILIQLDTAAVTQGDKTETWFDRAFDEEFATTEQEKQDSEEEIDFDVANTAEITKIRLGKSINIQEVQERDVYYASLPRISVHDKGKEPLVEDDPLPDSDSLKTLKEKEKLMLEWAGTDSLETAVKRRLYILAKYREMLLRKFLESHQKYLVPGQPWTATASQIIDLLSVSHSKSLEVLVTQLRENGLPIEQPCTSTYLDTSIGQAVSPTSQEENLYFVESPESPPRPLLSQDSTSSSSDSPVHFDSTDINLDSAANAQNSLPTANVDISSLLDALQASISQSVDTAHHDILSRLRTVEHNLQTSLGHQNDYLRSLIQSAIQEGQTQDDVQMLRLNEFKKVVLAQGVSAETNSLADRSRFHAIDAKFLLLDGKIVAIRNDQLEFQSKIATDILSLSTQIGDIADYIRGGDAKKGEIGSSSRRPPPVCVERRPLPTQANQGEISSGHGRVLNVEEAAEIVREADRQADRREIEREREKRLRRRGH
ncbi:hypothetical protein F511_24075 [Dorcoceras hygrometricum]|uniref:Uncharacterized protein n=1 Tax=Dorcoceras hygrometricum TaxID=472368 RepID=A0A2Z7BKN1_9LAMI|nr:hypothetical protein F511_24075 [Dorcoceras hygrometricum]